MDVNDFGGFKEQQIAFREISVKSGIFLPKTAVKFDTFLREISWALQIGNCGCALISSLEILGLGKLKRGISGLKMRPGSRGSVINGAQ